jgi:hypothetical protein
VLARWLHPGETAVVAYLERHAKKGQTIGLSIARKDVSYVYFGTDLDRRVVFARLGVNWLVIAPSRPKHTFMAGGRPVVESHGWLLLRVS